MADEKVNMGPEENKPPETLSPPGQGDLPPLEENNAPAVSGEDKTAPDHVEPDPPSADKHTQQTVLPGMGEDTPAPSGKVINLSDIQAADKDGKAASAPTPDKKTPEADKPPKRRGRPPKEQAGMSAGKKEKAAEPRTGRPSKVDKAAREEAPPAVRDKVSRGKKADKGKETGSGGAPASKPAQAVKPGKAAPVKEAAVPPPEINLPPTPDVPPRPVEEGKIVYLKMAELHPFHTFREHPYKVQDDKAMDDLVGTIKEHGIMTPATVRPEKDGKGYEIIAGHRRHHGGDILPPEAVFPDGLNAVGHQEVVLIVGDEAGPYIGVPALDDLQDHDGHHRGAADGQHHLPQVLEVGGAVHLGGVVQLVGDLGKVLL